jgi:hypothetical protein
VKVLVLYKRRVNDRRTINDHLYSFRNYINDVDLYYCDISLSLPFFINWIKFDGVILHYTLLAEKFALKHIGFPYSQLSKNLSRLTGYKIAIPQDEYYNTDAVIEFFQQCGVQTVFTCLPSSEFDKIYPLDKTGLQHRITTLTGFIDENSLDKFIGPIHSKRAIDIGYRARKLQYWYGRHAQLKHEIALRFNRLNQSQLKTDISTRIEDVFYDDDWIEFIKNCRTMLGCLGGVSLFHKDDRIIKKTENYLKKYPDASYDEVEQACFPHEEGNLNLFTLGPRHFECAMAKTCQVLVEGEYQGIFKPGIHYIELKKDFSNIEDVLKQIADVDHCEKIAERAFQDIVLSEKYTYRRFAVDVIDHIRAHGERQPQQRFRSSFVKFLLSIHTFMRTTKLRLGKIKRRFRPK